MRQALLWPVSKADAEKIDEIDKLIRKSFKKFEKSPLVSWSAHAANRIYFRHINKDKQRRLDNAVD